MSDDEAKWHEDGRRYGWQLPPKAHWLLRLPIIRMFRVAWLDYCAQKAAAEWSSVGIGVGSSNQRDLWILYAVARGWC